MTEPMPVFTRAHLQEAFELILSPKAATTWADEWWSFYASGSVDPNGYVLIDAEMWRPDPDEDDLGLESENAKIPKVGVVLAQPVTTGGYEIMANRTDDEKGEWLARRGFTDFILNLVAFASPEVSDRVEALRGDSDEGTKTSRRQMELIVKALRSEP